MKNFILTFLSIASVLYFIFCAFTDSGWIANWPESISDFYVKLMVVIFFILLFKPNNFKNNQNNTPYLT